MISVLLCFFGDSQARIKIAIFRLGGRQKWKSYDWQNLHIFKQDDVCVNVRNYAPMHLSIKPLSYCDMGLWASQGWCAILCHCFVFLWNFMILQTWKMHFTDEKHVLKSRKLKIRYKFHYFWKTRWFFFITNISKSLKKPRWFNSKLALGNAWNRIVAARTPVCLKKRRQKTCIKPIGFWWFWLWM